MISAELCFPEELQPVASVVVLLTNTEAWVRERTLPTEQPPLVGEVSANFFADRRCHEVSVTDP
jgi:hypothetical protein